jgi:hypothetical protein
VVGLGRKEAFEEAKTEELVECERFTSEVKSER